MGAEKEAQVRVGEAMYSKIQLGRGKIIFPTSSHLSFLPWGKFMVPLEIAA